MFRPVIFVNFRITYHRSKNFTVSDTYALSSTYFCVLSDKNFVYYEFIGGDHLKDLDMELAWSTCYVVLATEAVYGLRAGNIEFNTWNDEWVNVPVRVKTKVIRQQAEVA
jgi:hypothetical protein